MFSAEFEAEVKNGCIELPESLRDKIRVRFTQEEAPATGSIFIRWLASPIHVPGFTPRAREDAHDRSHAPIQRLGFRRLHSQLQDQCSHSFHIHHFGLG